MSIRKASRNCPNCFSRPCVAEENVSIVQHPDAPIAVCRDFFIKPKSVCAVPSGSGPRNWTLCGRRRATGKGNGCVLSSAKVGLLFRIVAFFCEKIFLFFDLSKRETITRGLFFDLPLVSLIALPLSPVAFPLGGEIGSCFLAHSVFFLFPAPQVGAPSRMTPSHAVTRTRALRTQQVSTFLPSPITYNLLNYCLLGVKAFAFP